MTTTYYDRFDPQAPWDRLLFRPDRILQSAEANELQSVLSHRIKGVADVLFADGDLVRAAGIAVDAVTGDTICEAGAIYAAGAVRGVPPGALTIATAGEVRVGVYLRARTVTDIDEPLLNNPATGTRGYNMPGAAREVTDVVWGIDGDGQDGTFYPVWLVVDGVVRPKDPAPTLAAITQAINRYDRDSAGGTYIVRGMAVTQLPDAPGGEQAYSVAEGAARIGGVGLDLPVALRATEAAAPDLLWVDAEPHLSAGPSPQRLEFQLWPAVGTPEARITSRKTVTLNHGGFAGAADALPDTAVLAIESVTQGATPYTQGDDYTLVANQVDWSPAGAEPAPGSSYDVTYTYLHNVAPTDVDSRGCTVAGALAGTLVLLSYDHAMRRVDRLCIDAGAQLHWVHGVPARYDPMPPPIPAGMLALASVYQTWDARRRVRLDGVRVVPMDELNGLRDTLNDVILDQAELRLATDIAGRYSGIKKGLFADPFINDDMRDAGIAQTAFIAGGALQLPLDLDIHQLATDVPGRAAPAHGCTPIVSQGARTGSMRVNPYQAFDPLPAPLTLTPSIDRWTETTTVVARARSEFVSWLSNTWVTERELKVTSTDLTWLRQISVRFDTRLKPGEALHSITFDGRTVAAAPLPGGSLTADAGGQLAGTFTVPPDVPAGSKAVRLLGVDGSRADAIFTGQGTAVRREVEHVQQVLFVSTGVDPLAQTFTLGKASQCCGADLYFTARGTSRVSVQLRTAELGVPTPNVLLQAQLDPADIHTDGSATRLTWPPLQLQAEREYALVVLCDDATTAAAVATLGAWDPHTSKWVTGQPYQVGVLLSSSNASTWTAHQDQDLAFHLLGPVYTEPERVLDLGSAEVTDATDLMLLAHIQQPGPGATGVLELELAASGQTHRLAPGQPLRLDAPYTGTVHARARLRAAAGLGAVLEAGVQLIAASLQASGTYITPMINAGGAGATVRAVFEAVLPSGSSLQVHAQSDAPGAPWELVPYLSASPQTAGAMEITHELTGFTADRLRLRITLLGAHNARPLLHNLRVAVL